MYIGFFFFILIELFCRPKSAVNCSNVSVRPETARTRYTRRTPAPPSRCLTFESEFDTNNFQRGSDESRTPYPHVSPYGSNYLTPDNISLRCGSPPPSYEASLPPTYTVKPLSGVDSAYAVIDDTLPTKKTDE